MQIWTVSGHFASGSGSWWLSPSRFSDGFDCQSWESCHWPKVVYTTGVSSEHNPDFDLGFNKWLASQNTEVFEKQWNSLSAEENSLSSVKGIQHQPKKPKLCKPLKNIANTAQFYSAVPGDGRDLHESWKGSCVSEYESVTAGLCELSMSGMENDTKGCLLIVCLVLFWYVTTLVTSEDGATIFWTPQLHILLFIAFVKVCCFFNTCF